MLVTIVERQDIMHETVGPEGEEWYQEVDEEVGHQEVEGGAPVGLVSAFTSFTDSIFHGDLPTLSSLDYKLILDLVFFYKIKY